MHLLRELDFAVNSPKQYLISAMINWIVDNVARLTS